MAETHLDSGEVDARIVYWGIEGSGKSTNLRVIHARLRPDHRGRLEQIPTRLDPTASYDRLPIELGEIAGLRTRIQIVAVPGAPEHAPTRKQLLDRTDGIVLVLDARRERIDENLASFEELRRALAAYGRRLEDVPLVVQYNKQDLSDPYVLEELHRKLDVRGAAVFEAVATHGQGVLQTLTTISKRVVRTLREGATPTAVAPPPARVDVEEAPPSFAPEQHPEEPLRAEPTRAGAAAELALPEPPLASDIEHAARASGDDVAPDERDAVVSQAGALLDASWPEAAAELELELDDTDAAAPASVAWRIVGLEAAELTGPRSLVLPLRLADTDGREVRLRLALSLDALPEEPDAS